MRVSETLGTNWMRAVHRRGTTWLVVLVTAVLTAACAERGDGTPHSLPGFSPASQTAEDGLEEGASGTKPSMSSTTAATDDGAEGDSTSPPERDSGPGPGGAPWDPCEIVTWQDMPDEMPSGDIEPQPIAPRSDADRFNAACHFPGSTNLINVLWGPAGKAVVREPSAHGEQQITVGGLTALQIITVDQNALMSCLVQVDLGGGRGVAGVGAAARRQNPEGASHPCAVTKMLTELIVERTA
jgi:hypothetical protein